MNSTSDTVLDEIWAIKDRLSATSGHDLAATCRTIYAEQDAAPGHFLVLGRTANAQQGGTGQPTTRPVLESEGSHKPQPEAEGHSRVPGLDVR